VAEAAKKTRKTKEKKPSVPTYWGTGRRKDSIARVRLIPGSGVISINKKEIKDYFGQDTQIAYATQALVSAKLQDKYDVFITASGGGVNGQAGAIRLGIARALLEADETLKETLKKAGFLTRDPRMKERRKYGLKKARKKPQFSKR